MKSMREGVRKVKAVLFDMDGVLVDTEKIYARYWKQAAAELGYDLPMEDILALRSCDHRLAAEIFLRRFGDEGIYHVVQKRRRELMRAWQAENRPEQKPGVRDLVFYLQKKSMTAAVVTAAPLRRARSYLESAGLSELFPLILSAENVERGKPFPDVYLAACRALDLAPCECAAVEDSPNGVMSASRAGCRVIMIPDLTPCTSDLASYVDWQFERLDQIIGAGIFE